jgi:hypothetical protein
MIVPIDTNYQCGAGPGCHCVFGVLSLCGDAIRFEYFNLYASSGLLCAVYQHRYGHRQ